MLNTDDPAYDADADADANADAADIDVDDADADSGADDPVWCGWCPFFIISASSARQIASQRESLEIYILDCFPTLSLRTKSDLLLYYNSISTFEYISYKVI